MSSLLASLERSREEGEVRVHTRHISHRLLVRQGRVVAARIGGHFDPILRRLRDSGELSASAFIAVLERMASTERKSGELAREYGTSYEAVQRGLRAQLRDALRALGRHIEAGARVELRRRTIEASEVEAWLPRTSTSNEPRSARSHTMGNLASRRALRTQVLALHPDRNGHLPEGERRARAEELARITARYHRL